MGINTTGFAQQATDNNQADLPVSQPKTQNDGDLRSALAEASASTLGLGGQGTFPYFNPQFPQAQPDAVNYQGSNPPSKFGQFMDRQTLKFSALGGPLGKVTGMSMGIPAPAQHQFQEGDLRAVNDQLFGGPQAGSPVAQLVDQQSGGLGKLDAEQARTLRGTFPPNMFPNNTGPTDGVGPLNTPILDQFREQGLGKLFNKGLNRLGSGAYTAAAFVDTGVENLLHGEDAAVARAQEHRDFRDKSFDTDNLVSEKGSPTEGKVKGLPTKTVKGAPAAKAAEAKAEEIANLDPVEAKYRETYNANPQLQAKALKFAQDNGLTGKTDEESINNAIRQGITNKADREQYVRSGAAQRDRAAINERMKQEVFAAAKQGGNAGITADARYRSAMGNFDAAVQQYGPKVGQALSDPAGLKESDPRAFQALQSTFGLPDPEAVATTPSSALAKLAQAPTGGGLRTGGSKFVQETASQLSQAVDFATAEMGGQLTPALQKELDGLTAELGKRRGSNSGGNSDFAKKRIGPFVRKLESAMATEKASVASQTAKSKAAKDMYAVALSEKKFNADQAYRAANLRLSVSKAKIASGKKVSELTPDQALKHMTNLAEEVDTEGIWGEYLKLKGDGATEDEVKQAMVGWAPNDATWLNLYLSTRNALK
jgi:hypothetical protein